MRAISAKSASKNAVLLVCGAFECLLSAVVVLRSLHPIGLNCPKRTLGYRLGRNILNGKGGQPNCVRGEKDGDRQGNWREKEMAIGAKDARKQRNNRAGIWTSIIASRTLAFQALLKQTN
jgi:hypothetical protein